MTSWIDLRQQDSLDTSSYWNDYSCEVWLVLCFYLAVWHNAWLLDGVYLLIREAWMQWRQAKSTGLLLAGKGRSVKEKQLERKQETWDVSFYQSFSYNAEARACLDADGTNTVERKKLTREREERNDNKYKWQSTVSEKDRNHASEDKLEFPGSPLPLWSEEGRRGKLKEQAGLFLY